MEKGNGKKEKQGEKDAIEEVAGKGGRAAHAGDEAWQCGASACLSTMVIGSVLRDFVGSGALFGNSRILVRGAP